MKPIKIILLKNSLVKVVYDTGDEEVKKARGKLFKPDMIQAIREGRKTQTRRFTAYDQPGDLIYMKEALAKSDRDNEKVEEIIYREKSNQYNYIFKSPLFMPREAARLWLLCTGRREEQVQDIS